MTCIKKNCRRRRVNATHCRECWNTVLVRRALRKPKPKRVQLAPSHEPLRGLNAQAGRAFLASLRVDNAANETSHKPNSWRLGKSPASC